jgi:Reverse transcriptase (RNA-dependent DNA polymerase)
MDLLHYHDVFNIPETFDQTWNHHDPFQCAHWHEVITLKYIKMEPMKVWIKVKCSTMPRGCQCAHCKCFFDIKHNDVFRAHLVACGYYQIPGVDFTEADIPVITDVTFWTLLLIQLIFGLCAWFLDVQVAFLRGDFEELIYMFCPEGLPHEPHEVLLLCKAVYGLVQTDHQFFKKFISIMKAISFEQNQSEPCMLFKKENSQTFTIIVIHVDNYYMIGTKENLDHSKEDWVSWP